MLEKYNRYQLMKVFLYNPTETFRLRELSRISKISPPSVVAYLREFEKQGIIASFTKEKVPFYKANLHDEMFSFYQKLAILYELHQSGLVSFLWEKLAPEAIILYGSFAKGEATEHSDIDMFIIGKEEEIDLSHFEEKLGKHIHLMFDRNVKKIPRELKNNLINGIVLKGYFKAV